MRRAAAGVSLLEVLCVLAIAAVLMMSVWRLVPLPFVMRVMQPIACCINWQSKAMLGWRSSSTKRDFTRQHDSGFGARELFECTVCATRRQVAAAGVFVFNHQRAGGAALAVGAVWVAGQRLQAVAKAMAVLTQMQCAPQINQQFEFSGGAMQRQERGVGLLEMLLVLVVVSVLLLAMGRYYGLARVSRGSSATKHRHLAHGAVQEATQPTSGRQCDTNVGAARLVPADIAQQGNLGR